MKSDSPTPNLESSSEEATIIKYILGKIIPYKYM